MASSAVRNDPRVVIDENPMSARQWLIIVLMIFLNGLDGFDVLSSAFASPGITAQWHISLAELGPVLSAELIGMGFGSVILGSLAHKIGRRLDVPLCTTVMPNGLFTPHSLHCGALLIVSSLASRFGTG